MDNVEVKCFCGNVLKGCHCHVTMEVIGSMDRTGKWEIDITKRDKHFDFTERCRECKKIIGMNKCA